MIVRASLLWLLLVSGVGCATVQPYEREHLARPGMDTSREAGGDRFYAHVREAREGALPETDTPGGGCGCN